MDTPVSQHSFGVDLSGLIDLLSEHLYGGPEVFVRELLQNGTDALSARGSLEGETFGPTLRLRLEGERLTFEDNGIGLSERDIHEFLATIGRSSKRGNAAAIGQFGIGLLSCFLVSDTIELTTRRVGDAQGWHWIGEAGGRYTLQAAEVAAPGTRVVLHARPDRSEYFTFAALHQHAGRFGALLPYPVVLSDEAHEVVVNAGGAPWRQRYPSDEARQAALLAYGEDWLGAPPLAVIDLTLPDGSLDGVAFILPWTPPTSSKGQHRLYLRGMLISEEGGEPLPDWAFFVRAVLNARDLRPNAARDAFYSDERLRAVHAQLHAHLSGYLSGLAEHDPELLRRLIALHYLAIKRLCLEDEHLFTLFLPWLPFETSLGRLTLPEFLRLSSEVRYVADLKLFRQVAQVAGAQGQAIIHAMYTYDAALLERYGSRHPEISVQALQPHDLEGAMTPLSSEARQQARLLGEVGREVLAPWDTELRVSDFEPADLAALYLPRDSFARELERARQKVGGGLWGDLLGDLGSDGEDEDPLRATLHLNWRHPLVRQAAALDDGPVLRRSVGMLYVQAMLLGHHPLGSAELRLLTGGMQDLIRWSLAHASDGATDASPPSALN